MDATDPGKPTILVVDDEALLRIHAVGILEDAGFATVEAGDAEEALACLAERLDITILFTDVNMPGPLDGLELAREVYRHRPDVRIIVASGQVKPCPGDLPPDGQFIAKPYQPAMITALVRAVAG